jgi:hypothetical protein
MEQPRGGPFKLVCVHANGGVTMQKGPVKERLNMRQIIPHVMQIKQIEFIGTPEGLINIFHVPHTYS